MSGETSKTADSIMSNKSLCRTCANAETYMVSLLIHKIENELLNDILFLCTSIKISEDDLLPQMICNSCLELLLISHKFRKRSQENDLIFRSAFVRQQLNNNNSIEQLNNFNCSSEVNIESTEEILSENHRIETNETSKIKNKSKLQCDLCGKIFTKKSSLVHHLRIHNGERNFVCLDCDKSFPTSSQLSAHQRTHNGYKPHACNICKKTFSKSSNLNVHLLVHRNEKRFTCKVCEKKFSQKSHLISHQNLHTGFRPFSCHCGATFITETNLKRHSNTHTGLKNYLCNFCGNLFTSCNDLNRHLFTHNNEKKDIVCNICFKHFTRLTSLSRHRKIFHK